MKNSKRFLLILLVLVMCCSLLFTAVACKDTTENEEEENKPAESFTNGNFETTSGDTYPLTPSSWTGAPGSNSAATDMATPSGSDSLAKGVISTDKSEFNRNKKTYGNIDNPGHTGDDDNILMIYNKVPTSYSYKSASVTLDADKYYRLSFDMRTLGTGSNGEFVATKKPGSDDYYTAPGAYVYMTGDAYAVFEAVDTLNEWKHFEIYVHSSKLASASLQLAFSLGTGNAQTGQLTQGYLFVDNVQLEDLTDVKEGETAFTQAQFDALERSATLAKYNISLGDADFDYASSTASAPYTPAKYTGIAGYGSGDNMQTGSSYMEKGLLDTRVTSNKTLADGQNIAVTTPEGSFGTRTLYIQTKQPGAYGYRSNNALVMEANHYYAVTLSVRTVLSKGDGKASIHLTKGANNDELGITIGNISTSGEWTDYTFYVAGNAKRDTSLYLEMWLGWGGSNDTATHVQGAAFFDNLRVRDISKEDFDAASESDTVKKFADALQSTGVTSVSNDSFVATNYGKNLPDAQRSKFDTTLDTAAWNAEAGFGENPLAPNATATAVIGLKNTVPSAFTFGSVTKAEPDNDESAIGEASKTLTIDPNKHYLVSMWVKTVDMPEGKGLTVELLKVDRTKKYAQGVTVLSTISNVNSKDQESSANENGYVEVKFYVQGAELVDNELALRFSLGTGTANQSASHIRGTVFVGDIAYETVTATDYTTASANATTQKASLRGTGSGVSSNGLFNQVDIAATNELYDSKDAITEGKLGVPSNWTITDKSQLTQDSPALGGSWYLTNYAQGAAFNVNSAADATNFLSGLNSKKDWMEKDLETYGSVLAMSNNGQQKPFGYKSNSISLEANSYYVFSVWAKVTDLESRFSIELATTGGSTKQEQKFHNITPTSTEWTQYFIFVETGASGASVKMGLYNGTPNGTLEINSTVFFTNIAYTKVSEDVYNNAVDKEEQAANSVLTLSWLVDSFDQYSEKQDALHTPSNWTGALVDSEASADTDDLVSGIFNRTNSDWNLLGINPDDAEGDYGIKMIERIFNDDTLAEGSTQPEKGNNVLAIYNKTETAYQYTSPSASLKPDTYYKVSVWVLTDLAENATATVRLKVNNQTYTFGKLSSSSNFNADLDGKRLVNGKEWTEYSYYIKTAKDLEEGDVSASLSIGLGFSGEDNWLKGRVFADNFSVQEVDKAAFESVATVAVSEDEDKIETWTVKPELVANNYVINFTKSDANAEKNVEEPKEENTNEPDELLWLYITSGVIGGLLVIAVVVVLIRKYAPKRKKVIKSAAKKNSNAGNKRDKFGK